MYSAESISAEGTYFRCSSEQSRSWQSKSRWTVQETVRLLWNQKNLLPSSQELFSYLGAYDIGCLQLHGSKSFTKTAIRSSCMEPEGYFVQKSSYV
jgi:hypothetical protein